MDELRDIVQNTTQLWPRPYRSNVKESLHLDSLTVSVIFYDFYIRKCRAAKAGALVEKKTCLVVFSLTESGFGIIYFIALA